MNRTIAQITKDAKEGRAMARTARANAKTYHALHCASIAKVCFGRAAKSAITGMPETAEFQIECGLQWLYHSERFNK